ncbi:type I restriction enzyme endonuclease domain-containing protein, partial [Lactobacillus delbrueckii subsp. bulgaricus]
MVATQKEAQELAPEIAFFGAVKVFLIKIKSNTSDPDRPDIIEVDYRLLQLIDQSIITEPEVDIYKDLGFERP